MHLNNTLDIVSVHYSRPQLNTNQQIIYLHNVSF